MNINYVEWRGIPPSVENSVFQFEHYEPEAFFSSVHPACLSDATHFWLPKSWNTVHVHIRVGVSSLISQFYSKIVERRRHLLVLGGIKVGHRIRSI